MAVLDSAKKVADGDQLDDGYFNDISGVTTVEAGENITSGNVVYVKASDGKAYVSDTGNAADTRADGFALNSPSSGSDVNIQTGGRYVTSGLTDKDEYFLGASGAISTTTSPVRIGIALSTTELWIDIPPRTNLTLIETKSVTAGTSADFTSLTQRKTFVLIFEITGTADNQDYDIRFNNDSGNNYSYILHTGATIAESTSQAQLRIGRTHSTYTHEFTGKLQFAGYANPDITLDIACSYIDTNVNNYANSGRWKKGSDGAITRITFLSGSNFTGKVSLYFITELE